MNQANSPVRWLVANYINCYGFFPVRNRDFRRWQEKHNSGGAFFAFSDVKWIQPNVDPVVL